MTRWSAVALRILAPLVLAAAPPALAASKAPPPRAHPDVAGEQECATCHRGQTPAAFAAWEASPHGLALVKCVVCHGSTGKDFRAKPAAAPATCGACHAAQVESVAKRPVKDCFACHAPHSLSAHPHR